MHTTRNVGRRLIYNNYNYDTTTFCYYYLKKT